jgi:hypothetical protein
MASWVEEAWEKKGTFILIARLFQVELDFAALEPVEEEVTSWVPIR